MRDLALIDRVARWRWFRRAASRRAVFALLAAALALAGLFPRRYVAELQFTTQESGGGNFGALLGQLGGVIAGVANRQSIEQTLAVARSYAVRAEVVRRLRLAEAADPAALRRAVGRLDAVLDVRVLRGSIVDVQVVGRDPDRALAIAAAYADVVRERLSALAAEGAAQKGRFLARQLGDAQARVVQAEAAVARFRRANALVAPTEQLGGGVGRTVGLEGALQAKQIQLDVARRSHSEASYEVRTLRAELAAIAGQLRAAQGQGGNSPAVLGDRIFQYNRLMTELGVLQTQYASLRRYQEASGVEATSADLAMSIVQPAYLQPGWSLNPWPAALCVLVLALGLAAEFHRLRPPPGTPPALP